jgi:NADH-quinone oxidoreductase subunit H
MVDVLLPLFGRNPTMWVVELIAHLITILIILLVSVGTMMLMVWFERRVVARMQDRLGPNRVGPAGLLQSIADGVKMFTKEDIVPRAADPWVHLLAPIVTVTPVVLMMAVIPWGKDIVPVEFRNGVLFVMAVSSISAVGLMMAGWGSANKFALLGAMRAVAQLVSYEIPAVLAVLSVVIITGTMQLTQLPESQAGLPIVGTTLGIDLGLGWWVFTPVGLCGFVVFFISALAEGERTPFDIPEADSEIVAGHTTEYSGMKFALFYIGQYVLNFALSMFGAIIFLGGWQGPGVSQLSAVSPIAGSVLSLIYLQLKVWGLFFVMVWLRGTLPRLRVDQLMDFAWKFLLPLALLNLASAALWVSLTQWGADQGFGFVANLSPVVRQVIAVVVSAIISGSAAWWLLQLNQAEQHEADASNGEELAPSV